MNVGLLKTYPMTRGSGVDWLGAVPAHWELPRLGAVLRERGELNHDGRIEDVLSVVRNRGVIPYSEKGNVGNKKSDDVTRYKIVRPGDIVLNSMNVIIGSVGLSQYTGCLSPVYYVLTSRSDNDDVRYFSALFQARPFQKGLVRLGNGILAHRMRIPMELLKCEPFPRPPREEQAAIARFLDHMDRRIQKYIHAKQKLIALLVEYKQALIHQAVTGQIDVRTGDVRDSRGGCRMTGGLKPYPKMKESGSESLGMVPGHWEVRRLGQMGTFSKGNGGNKADETSSGIPCIRYGDLYTSHHFFIRKSRSFVTRERAQEYTPIQFGDVLFAGSGETIDEIGKSAVNLIQSQSRCGGDVIIFRPSREVDARFLGYATDCAAAAIQKAKMGRGITIMHIYGNELKYLAVALPPLPEQTAITRFLEKYTSHCDAIIAATCQQIGAAGEYWTRLVSDVVTGKLDVREAAATLPDVDPIDDGSSNPLIQIDTHDLDEATVVA